MERLQDYLSPKTLDAYDQFAEGAKGQSMDMYNVKLAMPDVKGKVVLDMACGMGYYVRECFMLGAAKIIASDIVPGQLDISKEKDAAAGIPPGVVEYYQHDAKIPKQLSSELADVCFGIHLFCFAEDVAELRAMIRTVRANLKPGGRGLFLVAALCSSFLYADEKTLREELAKYNEELIELSPPSTDRFHPRKLHLVDGGFHFESFAWQLEAVCEVMREEGFSRTELLPGQVDPSYHGDLDMQGYMTLYDRRMLLAWN